MNTLLDTLQYFVIITIELLVLFVLITAIVEFIMMYISEDKMQKYLSGRGLWGNIIASGLGALTPFCACSTIPMTVGFLNAKVPFGATMSFLIASPLINPIIIGMLAVLVGVKTAILYF
ncbi:MAG: permease, partial [Bacteroidales bacterium]|nr:permease [Bacteroidales bacterium]